LAQPERKVALHSAETRLEVCQIIGRLMELWGFRRNLGRIWTLLYLSDGPVSAAAIAGQLAISRGSTSVALQELLRWGVVRKSWKTGERKEYFAAEEDVAKMVLRVLNERELPAIDDAIASLGEVLRTAERDGVAEEDPHLRARAGDLLGVIKTGRSLTAWLAGPRSPAHPFMKRFGREKDRS